MIPPSDVVFLEEPQEKSSSDKLIKSKARHEIINGYLKQLIIAG